MRTKPPNTRQWPGLAIVMFAGLWVLLTGCRSVPLVSPLVTLTVQGDPGVTVRIVSSRPDTVPVETAAPATLRFRGGKFELRCLHGPQPGRLSLSLQRDAAHLATGDLSQPGETAVFSIRPDSITSRVLPAQ